MFFFILFYFFGEDKVSINLLFIFGQGNEGVLMCEDSCMPDHKFSLRPRPVFTVSLFIHL